jgi:large subunit ribosomal protein L31
LFPDILRAFSSGAKAMKSGIHPEYKPVIFLDTSANHSFLTRSAIDTKGRETMKWSDGNEYPVVKLEVSSESHSYYTGKQKIVDTAGRVEKFKRRYTKKADKKAE